MLHFEEMNHSITESNSFTVKQSSTYRDGCYWNWRVWIEAEDYDKMDKIVSVTYHLHHTFPDPVRVIIDRGTNFRLETSGWGEFLIFVIIKLKDDTFVELEHELKLFDDNVETFL